MVQADHPIRVRFAPSPTGHLHIGSLRCALFNWLFARTHGGVFILRIEDTDLERSKQEYVDSILHAFKWAGIESDEPIQYQTQRFALYQSYIDRLLLEGKAYWSDPTQEENGVSVVRFRLPKGRAAVRFHDLVHGEISFELDQIGGDFVIARADGSPLYNFVVVVDDIDMRISHVIRGDDHISNTPKQILLYEAIGAPLPAFAHLPMILGPTGAKLSKRDAVTSVLAYRDMGILPDALCNYLVRLSWAHGDQEVFTRQEMINLFSLAEVNKSGAIFDMAKLLWMNGIYLKSAPLGWLIDYIGAQLGIDVNVGFSRWSPEQRERVFVLYQERVSTIRELLDIVHSVYDGPAELVLPVAEGWDGATGHRLGVFAERLLQLQHCSPESVGQLVKELCKEDGVPLAALAKPIRFALTGQLSSPSVYELVALLGAIETERRIARLRKVLG
ncbi:MAG: glutamate--tRNA ligase [Candidatus Dependentiae bacterium]|nr:glutamate--tRNA ligase [Candidatus Dependentiae bacterium]